jgi:hypothetical protein
MQVEGTSSLLMVESIMRSSGVISYDNRPTSPIRPLHVEGNKIKDDMGNIVYLRGVNRPRAVDHPSGCWGGWGLYKQSVVEFVLTKMEEYGINCIRYFIAAEFWINNPTVSTEQGSMTFRQILDDLLTRCENHDVYLILCTMTVIHGYHDAMAYPPYTQNSGSNLIPNAAAFVDYIIEQVDVLGSHINLIIEPYNEPWTAGAGYWASNARLDEFETVWQDIINGVRAKEDEKSFDHHLIMVGYGAGIGYWGDMSLPWRNFNWIDARPLTDSAGNLVYTTHAYRYHGAVGTQEPKDTRPTAYATIKQIYIEEEVYNWSLQKPIFIGEIGAYSTIGGEEVWLENTLTILNEWNLGYAAWAWRDTGTAWDILEYISGPYQNENDYCMLNDKGRIFVDTIAAGKA